MTYTLQEIENQPDGWRRVIDDFYRKKDKLSQDLIRFPLSRIITVCCGCTYFLCCSAAQLVNLFTSFDAQAYPAS